MTDSGNHCDPRRTAMERLFSDYGDAWASHDAAAIASFHADDGIFHLHAGAEEVRGRDAIRDTSPAFWPSSRTSTSPSSSGWSRTGAGSCAGG